MGLRQPISGSKCMKLDQRKVLVTGATAGIGAALVDLLLRKGCQIIVTGRQDTVLKAMGARPGLFPIRCDFANAQDVTELANHVRQTHPDLSAVFNNAGVQHEIAVAGTQTSRLEEIVTTETAVNYVAPVCLTLQLLPVLSRQPDALIVNVTTPLAMSPKRSSPFYCASKAALRIFTKSLRFQLEIDHPKIRVVEAQPPLVDTAMTRGRGKGKISPEQAAAGIVEGIERGKQEIYVGKAKLLRFIYRCMPSLAERITKAW